MPKRGKRNKQARDLAVIAGVKKHRAFFEETPITPAKLGADDLIALFQAHYDAIADIAKYDALRRRAVALERKLERGLSQPWRSIKLMMKVRYGDETTLVLDFGMKPHRKPVISAATKAAAVEKRRATRKRKGTMGSRQRKKLQGR